MQRSPTYPYVASGSPERRSATLPPGFEVVERCDLCGGGDFRSTAVFDENLLFTGEAFNLVTCRDCGLRFLNPRPNKDLIGFYYGAAYDGTPRPSGELAPWQRMAGEAAEGRQSTFERLFLHVRQSLSWHLVPPWEGGGRALDIGCGGGVLLDLLRQLGWDTYGVEVSPVVAARAAAGGHRIACGSAEALHFEPRSFDLVYMWHVLEHTHSPAQALAQAHRYLKPGGRLYLAVPNYRSLQSRLLRRYASNTDAPRHLYQFERKTIAQYLGQTGFEALHITTRSGSASWARSLRNLVNGLMGVRLAGDPRWLRALFELPVAVSSLFRFFGMGSELRITCRRQASTTGKILPLPRL